MHMVWQMAFSTRLGTSYQYSAILCYNTFPLPDLTEKQKNVIECYAYAVLEERERHPENTLAELYDPDKMPDLPHAHNNLDIAVERCYRSMPFTSDDERLEYLLNLYEEMCNKERRRFKMMFTRGDGYLSISVIKMEIFLAKNVCLSIIYKTSLMQKEPKHA